MKPDEKMFLEEIKKRKNMKDESVISISERLNIPYNRARYICFKWTDKGLYNYGIGWEYGWLTDLGKQKEVK